MLIISVWRPPSVEVHSLTALAGCAAHRHTNCGAGAVRGELGAGTSRRRMLCKRSVRKPRQARPGARGTDRHSAFYEQGFILSPGFHSVLQVSQGKKLRVSALTCSACCLYLRTSVCPPPLASMEVGGGEAAAAQSARARDASSDSDSDFEEVEASAEDMERITDLEAELSVNANLYDKHVEVHAEL